MIQSRWTKGSEGSEAFCLEIREGRRFCNTALFQKIDGYSSLSAGTTRIDRAESTFDYPADARPS